MTDRRMEELITARIDGAATGEEIQELEKLMHRHPEVARAFAEQTRAQEALGRVGQVAAPRDLARSIMRSVRPPASGSQESWWKSFFSGFGRQGNLRYAYSFALGAMAAVAIFLIVPGARIGVLTESGLTGTMAPPRTGAPLLTDAVAIQTDEIRGSAQIRTTEEEIWAELDLRGSALAEIVIDFDPAALSLKEFHQVNAPGTPVSWGRDQLRVSHDGDNVYRLILDRHGPRPEPVRVRIFAPDLVFDRSLRAGPDSE